MFGASLCINGKKHDAQSFNDPCIKAIFTEEGDGYLYRRFALSNESENKSGRFTDPYVLDAVIECKNKAFVHSITGDNFTKESFSFNDKDLGIKEEFIMIPSDGRSSDTTAFPFFDITVDNKTYVLGIGWTGMWKCEIKRSENNVNITVGLAHADFCILPGETLNLPSVCIVEGKENESAADVRRRFRRVMLKHFNGLPKNRSQLPKAA